MAGEKGVDLVVAAAGRGQAWLGWAIYGVSYALLTRALSARRAGALDYLLLVLLTGSAIGISYYSGSGLGSILLMVVACVLPWLLPLSVGIAVLTLSELVVVPVYMRALGFSWRSEEHTSELQSLMRNSYAVFCLKKKKK